MYQIGKLSSKLSIYILLRSYGGLCDPPIQSAEITVDKITDISNNY